MYYVEDQLGHSTCIYQYICVRLLFEGDYYLCVATISGGLLFVCGYYFRGTTICVWLLFEGDYYLCVATI